MSRSLLLGWAQLNVAIVVLAVSPFAFGQQSQFPLNQGSQSASGQFNSGGNPRFQTQPSQGNPASFQRNQPARQSGQTQNAQNSQNSATVPGGQTGGQRNFGPAAPRQPAPNRQPPANLRQAPRRQTQPRPLRLKLTPEHRKYVGQILDYWEERAKKVERYKCDFQRFTYDPVFGPADKPKAISVGQVKYASPDKGLFEVTEEKVFTPSRIPGGQAQYQPVQGKVEKWISDGKNIFEFDNVKKQLTQYELPPELHGKAIANGPLPFLFNASRKKIEDRYELQVITPADKVKEEYWLEAFPRWGVDAANFQKVHIYLDRKMYLPKAIILFAPNFDPRSNPARTVYILKDREVNWSTGLNALNIFHREFFDPATPSGWTKVVERQQPTNARSANGTPPTGGQPRR